MVTHVVDEALRWQADTTAQQATPDRHNSTINTHSHTSPAAEKTTTGWCRIHWTIHTFNRVHDEKSHKITTLTIVEQTNKKKENKCFYILR